MLPILSYTSFAFRRASGIHLPSGTSGKHTVTRHCDHKTSHACACVRFNLQWPDHSVGPVSVTNVQYYKLTLICIVFHFELKVTCVRLHCQHATLQVLLFAIMGVFKGNVSLERGTKKCCVYDQAMFKAAKVLNVRNPMRLFDLSGRGLHTHHFGTDPQNNQHWNVWDKNDSRLLCRYSKWKSMRVGGK